MAITYNATVTTCSNIYTTTSGGTVFSSNLNASTAFNYFSNTAVVNDAIYFLVASTAFSNLTFNVGTAMAGTGITLVWEYSRMDRQKLFPTNQDQESLHQLSHLLTRRDLWESRPRTRLRSTQREPYMTSRDSQVENSMTKRFKKTPSSCLIRQSTEMESQSYRLQSRERPRRCRQRKSLPWFSPR